LGGRGDSCSTPSALPQAEKEKFNHHTPAHQDRTLPLSLLFDTHSFVGYIKELCFSAKTDFSIRHAELNTVPLFVKK